VDEALPSAAEVRARFRNLHLHQQDGVKSPHKPLLAVARLMNSGSSSTPYSVAEAALAPLLTELGAAPGTSVAYPFTRLRSDDIWILTVTTLC
jgi:putative restriction endonuclease